MLFAALPLFQKYRTVKYYFAFNALQPPLFSVIFFFIFHLNISFVALFGTYSTSALTYKNPPILHPIQLSQLSSGQASLFLFCHRFPYIYSSPLLSLHLQPVQSRSHQTLRFLHRTAQGFDIQRRYTEYYTA